MCDGNIVLLLVFFGRHSLFCDIGIEYMATREYKVPGISYSITPINMSTNLKSRGRKHLPKIVKKQLKIKTNKQTNKQTNKNKEA